MKGMRALAGACAFAVVAATITLPAGGAAGAVISTKISLAEFKSAYGLASVRRLIDPISDGVRFFLVKRDKNGQKIDWSDPNRANVDATKSFIGFRADTSQLAALFASLMQASVQFRLAGGPSIPAVISCGLNGSSSAGVNAVQCGGGATVSPS